MFCKATLITTVALALLSTATPITRDEPSVTTNTSIRVPLHKRGSLRNADGIFNHDKAIRELVKLKK